MKILVVGQSPVSVSRGGSEVAAENLVRELSRSGFEVEFATAVPYSYSAAPVTVFDSNLGVNRHFIPSVASHPYFINADPESVNWWRLVVEMSTPDIIHFHHFFNVGLNVIEQIKRLFQAIPIVLTLHEYLAICLRDGQLVRPAGNRCESRTPIDCLSCNKSSFNDMGLNYVLTRNYLFQKILTSLDHLIAPSNFLRNQFISWGISPQRISYIPNVIRAPRSKIYSARSHEIRVLFLSSPTKLKGIDVFIEAAHIFLKRSLFSETVVFEIWSTDLAPGISGEVHKMLIEGSPFIKMMGGFERDSLDEVLQGASLVVCPSVWFENRPTVIDEALIRGIPSIVSNIGGMAEQAKRNPTVFTFEVGNSVELAETMFSVLATDVYPQTTSLDFLNSVDQHQELYSRMLVSINH